MSNITVGDVMQGFGMLELSSEETGDSASERILTGRIGIVSAPGSTPIGVLTRKRYFTLQGVGEKLGEHRELMSPICLTTPDTDLVKVVKILSMNRGVNWYLAMQEGRVAGYIAPNMLFQIIRTNRNYGQVFVSPHNPTSTHCYCCQPQLPDTRHKVSDTDADKNKFGGVRLCPTHKFPLIIKSPCDDEC